MTNTMTNKLQEILDEFHSLYGWRLQDDLQQEVREYLCNKIVEYAKYRVKNRKILYCIDQDVQSIND